MDRLNMTLHDYGHHVGDESLDLAEELFVACRFDDAARVCNDTLRSICSSPPGSQSKDEATPSAHMVPFEDSMIAPLGTCDNADLIVAILLQCGFELKRPEDWAQCHAFYSLRGAIPFAIATLW